MKHSYATTFTLTIASAAVVAFGATRSVRAQNNQDGLRAIP